MCKYMFVEKLNELSQKIPLSPISRKNNVLVTFRKSFSAYVFDLWKFQMAIFPKDDMISLIILFGNENYSKKKTLRFSGRF